MRSWREIELELKRFWDVQEFVFEAQYATNKNGAGYFRNVRKKTDKSKVFLPNKKELTVRSPKNMEYELGKTYVINVFIANDTLRAKLKNEYLIFLDTNRKPPLLIQSIPESYVKSLEKEYKSVIGIGLDSLKGAIKRISYDINRKPETFIFELLQNADDYPDKQRGSVDVSFKIIDDYLIFQHNGLPFNENNVRALCSVDAGDKEYDFDKIGYKGIGFKSIFKHSNYVIVHSGGFSFRFDENFHRDKGIDTFWQLIPVWTKLTELPVALVNKIDEDFAVTIIIKPEEGNNQLVSYEETFNKIFKDERVLLFLRWVEHFVFEGSGTKIIRKNDSNFWAISDLGSVVIPDELKKTMNDRIKIDDRIPQKYEDIEKSILTFATQKVAGKIRPTEQAHIYAYLPTDLDFGFPFLLNGDFIPDGGRHYLHADLEWNQFLFNQAGRQLLKWIASLWSETKDVGVFEMLPDEKKLVSERSNDERETLLNCFFTGLAEEQYISRFIPDEKGGLYTSSEIILDETGLFNGSIFKGDLFFQIFQTTKKLPLNSLNLSRLFSKYLEIEKFTSDQLINLFAIDEKKLILKSFIEELSHEGYVDFMRWLNEFSYKNSVSKAWLLSLPIIRLSDKILDINKTLSTKLFLIKTLKSKDIESILIKAGFTLSEIYYDIDKYNIIYGTMLQQNSYLSNDVELYDHILSNTNFSDLNQVEKNQLITFFAGLKEVGRAKYAQTLSLFKSKVNGSLKPLSHLISNKVENLPIWLLDFVINEEEENVLSLQFQKELLQEKDFLEKLFCNKGVFNEIVSKVNIENINDFYSYLLKLKGNQPEEFENNFSGIPWIFIEATNTFAEPTEVFWPESLLSLSKEKYFSVKNVIETISNEKLPHFSALQLKGSFSLGGKNVKLQEIIKSVGTFDLITANDFLDWAEANGESNYFFQTTVSEENGKYQFTPNKETVNYYTDDIGLITFISGSVLNSRMNLLPKAVFSSGRSKLGLLAGVNLMQHLITNRLAVISLSTFVQKHNDESLSLEYLQSLPGLNIDTTKTYNQNSDEFKILKIVCQYLIKDSDEEKLRDFRAKITLDESPLLEKAISDDIRFNNNGKTVELKIKLSEILPSYLNKTYSITKIINIFIDFKDEGKLKKVFRAERRSNQQIIKALSEEGKPYLTPAQTLYFSYFQDFYKTSSVFKDRLIFTKNKTDNQTLFQKEIEEFLDICLREDNFIGFVSQEIIPDFNPSMCILNKEFAIEKEQIPDWLDKWSEEGKNEKKKSFFKTLGINDNSSSIVLFRKAIQEAQPEVMNLNRELVDNNPLLINTLQWLSEQQKEGKFELKKEVLQPLFQKLQNKKVTVNELRFPCLIKYEENSYSLEQINSDSELHFINDGWGIYKQTIFSSLKGNKKITDDVISKFYRDAWKVIEKGFTEELDIKHIAGNSYRFDEEYYQEWEFNDKYNIIIYRGEKLPYLVKYHERVIKHIEDKFADRYNSNYYIAENKKEFLFSLLEGLLEGGNIDSLRAQSHKYSEKEKESEKFGKVHFTEKESATWKKLFGNEIPSDFYKDINLAACVSALVMLSDEGYDLSKAEVNLSDTHLFSQIEPVIKEGSFQEELTIMCRSAIGGILYLTAQAWDRLDEEEVLLFVKTGKEDQDYQFFMDKQDVLAISDTRYQVFRVDADSSISTTDDILQGNFPKDKIWLILKMKENETYKSIFEGGIKKNEKYPDLESVNTAEEGLY